MYGDVGQGWKKGKAECKNSPTLNDQYVRDVLGKVVCNGEYDENVVRDRVKRMDVYENRMIICYVEKGRYQILLFGKLDDAFNITLNATVLC